MILSENRFPSPIGVEDKLFGIMRWRLALAEVACPDKPARDATFLGEQANGEDTLATW
jgi:hypothetical protein